MWELTCAHGHIHLQSNQARGWSWECGQEMTLALFFLVGHKKQNDLSCLETLPCGPASWGVLLGLTEAIPFSKALAHTWFQIYFSEVGIQESCSEYEWRATPPRSRLSPNTKA